MVWQALVSKEEPCAFTWEGQGGTKTSPVGFNLVVSDGARSAQNDI